MVEKITVNQAALKFGIKPVSILAAIRRGALQAVKVDNVYQVSYHHMASFADKFRGKKYDINEIEKYLSDSKEHNKMYQKDHTEELREQRRERDKKRYANMTADELSKKRKTVNEYRMQHRKSNKEDLVRLEHKYLNDFIEAVESINDHVLREEFREFIQIMGDENLKKTFRKFLKIKLNWDSKYR